MAAFVVPDTTAAFATNGAATGSFTVASIAGLYLDSIVNITADSQPNLRCKIISIISSSKTIKVQTAVEFLAANAGGASYPKIPDLTAYTTAAHASCYQPSQIVSVVGQQFFIAGTTPIP